MMSYACSNPVYGSTLHPQDPLRTPGGSSGGEACLIAMGGSPLGIGSDVGGSLRIPSHFCGIAALKPTSGTDNNLAFFAPKITNWNLCRLIFWAIP